MAINVTVLEFEKAAKMPGGQALAAPQFPEVAGANVTAAGETTLAATTRIVEVRNNTAGDSVLVRLREAGSGNASLSTGRQITAGNSSLFFVPARRTGVDYELDVRAG